MEILLKILCLILIGATTTIAQDRDEEWDAYIAFYEDGHPGSTTLRMDLIDKAPIEEFPYVLVTGITYETSREDGFPEGETFQILYKLEDELVELVAKETESVIVGSFTYKQERLEYLYIKGEVGLKRKIEDFYAENFPEYEFYLKIEEDKDWSHYREFLYPNEETLDYMADEAVIRHLKEAGDPLTKARRVDHYLYFPTKLDMAKCAEELKKLNFLIQFSGKNEKSSLPFELQVYRVDQVDIESIYSITSKLRKAAEEYNGDYDGWETSVEKE